jgi:hypothetical protein
MYQAIKLSLDGSSPMKVKTAKTSSIQFLWFERAVFGWAYLRSRLRTSMGIGRPFTAAMPNLTENPQIYADGVLA